MQETRVSLNVVITVGLWAGTVGLLLAGTLVGLETDNIVLCVVLIGHALALAAAAAAAQVRSYVDRQNRLLVDVFELGKRQGAVREMRRGL